MSAHMSRQARALSKLTNYILADRRRKVKKKKKINKCCETCGQFLPIGEGDHICEESLLMVVSGYEPTEDYFQCGGRKWEEK